MQNITLRSFAIVALLMMLSGCSASCHCPTCPADSSQPTTTIIHDHPDRDY